MQPGDYWREGFILPVKGRISGEFGNQRIFNGTPKSPHSGTDIAAPEGTPVKASGSGKVILSGKTILHRQHGHHRPRSGAANDLCPFERS